MEFKSKVTKGASEFGADDFFKGMQFKSAAPQASLKQISKERQIEKHGQ